MFKSVSYWHTYDIEYGQFRKKLYDFLIIFLEAQPKDGKVPALFDQVKAHLFNTGKNAWNNYISPNLPRGLKDVKTNRHADCK